MCGPLDPGEHETATREALLEQLRTASAQYRAVVEASPALIVAIDASGAIERVNAAVESSSGFAREELLGRPFERALLPPSALDAWRERRAGDAPLRTRSGRECVVDWRYAAADGLDYAIGLDVTEARALDRRARQAEQLASAGELTSGLAHEVRNPLNAALLELKVLTRHLERAGDRGGIASAAVVRGELERLERLLAELLDIASPRIGERVLGDLAGPARAVARLMAAEAHARGIAMVTDFAAPGAIARFDEERVRQVVRTLVRNAIEALDGARGTIRVRTGAAGRFAELAVEDDGPGIEGDASRVFRAFHTTKALGTGLGLTIARRIATEHAGELRVESAPGRTVFTLALPAAA